MVESEQLMMAIIGFVSGGLALLACYFLLTYIFMRSPVRFWFASFTGAFLLLFLNIRNMTTEETTELGEMSKRNNT